jgi:hypothetical protein
VSTWRACLLAQPHDLHIPATQHVCRFPQYLTLLLHLPVCVYALSPPSRILPDELGSRAVGLLEALLALLAGESLSAAKLLKALELLAVAQQVGGRGAAGTAADRGAPGCTCNPLPVRGGKT